MLPINLTLRNFLSYKEGAPTLRLEDVHVACLCGANGVGKSALLDAITWALWGRARGQRQEQLVHHGQQEMSVALEFAVGETRYCVTRRYSRARRTPQSSLELTVQAGADYRPVTGNTIAETQAEIIRRISMDYDTFVNSAFLVQGRADQFSMATPMERKVVLSRVLGLEMYERLEARAKLRGRELQGKLTALDFQIERLRLRVADGDSVRESLDKAREEARTAEEQATSVGERLALLVRHVEHLERRGAEADGLTERLARVSARIAEARKETVELERRLSEWRSAVAREAEIQAGYARLAQARERLRTLNADGQRVLALQRDLAPLDQRISSARATLEGEVSARWRLVESELTPKASSLPAVSEQLDRVASEAAALVERGDEAARVAEEERELRLSARRLEDENERLVEQGKETGNKLALLDHEHAEGVACPLCGTPLAPDARAHTQEAFEREIAEQRKRYRAQADEVQSLDARADDLSKRALALHQAVEAGRQQLSAERAKLTLQRDDAEQAQALLGGAETALAEAQERLDRGEYAVEEQQAAHRLRTEIAEIAFDPQAVGTAEASLREEEHWDVEHRALAQARERLPEDEEAHRRASGRVSEDEEELGRIAAQLEAVRKETAELDGYQRQRDAVKREAAEAERRRDELRTRMGSLTRQTEEIAEAAAELRSREQERQGAARDAGNYGELALAFGKGGVQALLIEAAIPRLEDEANDLLKLMTAGRMSLKVETQRARRTGGGDAAETLEIVIADELGTRSYEMFSGGERFRVDFALRIALSKLLAWRAGAPLPTLFVDEGFGTQDAEGRDRILDVIKAIEDRFQRILVITHMDEIKEAFPVRIEVTRNLEGSTFSMS